MLISSKTGDTGVWNETLSPKSIAQNAVLHPTDTKYWTCQKLMNVIACNFKSQQHFMTANISYIMKWDFKTNFICLTIIHIKYVS